MNEPRDLQEIELRAYQTLWEDGLLDVFVGLGVVGIGISWVTGFAIYGAILPAILVPLWQAARKRIVEPRSGYVEFSGEREKHEKLRLGVLALLGVCAFALGVGVYFMVRTSPPGPEGVMPVLIPALPAALLGIGGALVGLLFAIPRFVVYSALLFLGGLAGAFVGAEPGWHFLPPGAVILIVGLMLLTSFLKKYPASEVQGLS